MYVYLVVCVCRFCMYICCRYCITVECTVLYSIDMMQCSPPDNDAVEPVGCVLRGCFYTVYSEVAMAF